MSIYVCINMSKKIKCESKIFYIGNHICSFTSMIIEHPLFMSQLFSLSCQYLLKCFSYHLQIVHIMIPTYNTNAYEVLHDIHKYFTFGHHKCSLTYMTTSVLTGQLVTITVYISVHLQVNMVLHRSIELLPVNGKYFCPCPFSISYWYKECSFSSVLEFL